MTGVGYPLSVQQAEAFTRPDAGGINWCSRHLEGVTADEAQSRLREAMKRHEVLRSTLQSSAALRTSLQTVHDSPTWAVSVVDHGDDPEQAIEVCRRQIDVTKGPVLAAVLREEQAGCLLLLCASAMFADVRTLEEVAEEAGGRRQVDDPIQYAEYAAWQSEVRGDDASEDAAAASAAWEEMAPDPVGTRLPSIAGAPEPSQPDGTTSTTTIDLRGRPLAGAGSIAHWLAVWSVTVSRLTGEESVTLGVELDPREDNPELTGAAGPYSRVVPLTLVVPRAGSFSAYIAHVAERLQQARTWFEWAPRAANLSVLFSQGPRSAHAARGDFQVELRAVDEDSAEVRVGSEGSHALAEGVLQALGRVMASGCDLVEDLEVLAPSQVEALLGAPPHSGQPEPVVSRVLAHARAHPDAVAVTDGRMELSYGTLASAIRRLAGALLEASPAATGPVGVHLPRSADAIVAMLAAQAAGLGYVPLDPAVPAGRTLLQARLSEMSVLISAAPPEGWTGPVVPVDAPGPNGAGSQDVADGHVTGAALAYVMFTSGSSGVPKGVAVSQRALAGYAEAVLEVIESAARRRGAELVWGLVTSLTTDLGHTSVYGALASGGTLHIVPADLVQDPAGLSGHLAEFPVDVLKITPTHLRALMSDPTADVLPKGVLVTGGETLTWELASHVLQGGSCRLLNHYGPTETTVGALTHLVEGGSPTHRGAVPIGEPLRGYEALVVDSRLRLVPPGAVGELLVAGVGVADGYVGDEAQTAGAFIDHPYRSGERAYRTGDIVRRDSRGVVTFLGRRDAQLKVRGYRVEPHEIELALTQHPEVRRAAVVLRSDVGPEPLLVGYVVTQVNPAPSEEELRAHTAGLLPDHMVPSRIVDLDSLPLRANGKLDVQALPAPTEQVRATQSEPPEGETEQVLADIFAESLGLAAVGAEDDFFALGGHSLLATRVVVEIRSRLEVRLPIYTLFEAPTVRLLAAEVDAARGEVSADELSALIAEISSMSDEEAARRLAEEAPPDELSEPRDTT